MHQSTCRPRVLLGGGVLLTLLLGFATGGQAQDAKGTIIVVPIGGTKSLQMTTKKAIRTVDNKSGKENVVNIRTVQGDPTTVLLIGQQPDLIQIELTDVDGKRETYDVLVQLDVAYLRTQLKAAVPTAAVAVTPVSGNTVILGGTVQR